MLLVLAALCSGGVSRAMAGGASACEATLLPAGEAIAFQDDLHLADLDAALNQSLRVLGKLPATREYRLCGESYSVAWLMESLREFQQVAQRAPSSQAWQRELAERFTVCRAGKREKPGKILLTGYFEPLAEGSLIAQGAYRYPLYQRPADLAEREGANGKEWGRYEQGV
ncbi:MAG TPA: MltA domain-containing protein, partial [Desulfurivibrionaceae bacterium]|nr:MltA domain-containing protein [Desulfurivibrionaceae bacterium]